MKRGRKDQLTGGSHDVNPQTLVSPILAQTGVNTFDLFQLAMPIPRIPSSDGTQLIIELLKVKYVWNALPALTTPGINQYYMSVTTNPNKISTIEGNTADPRQLSDFISVIFSNTADGQLEVPTDFEDNLTDDAGHGILIATDNLYFLIGSSGMAGGLRGVVRLLYRFKRVTLIEYVGIVQSQQ